MDHSKLWNNFSYETELWPLHRAEMLKQTAGQHNHVLRLLNELEEKVYSLEQAATIYHDLALDLFVLTEKTAPCSLSEKAHLLEKRIHSISQSLQHSWQNGNPEPPSSESCPTSPTTSESSSSPATSPESSSNTSETLTKITPSSDTTTPTSPPSDLGPPCPTCNDTVITPIRSTCHCANNRSPDRNPDNSSVPGDESPEPTRMVGPMRLWGRATRDNG